MTGVRFADVQARPAEVLNLTSLTLEEVEALVGPFEGPPDAGSAGGISPPAAHRTVRKPLDLHGSSQPLPCHLAMTVDAESDRSSRLPGWRPPSLSWVIRFAPRSLQALRHYYRMIRPCHRVIAFQIWARSFAR